MAHRVATDQTLQPGTNLVVGASATKDASKTFGIVGRGDSILVVAKVSAVTNTSTTAKIKLQHACMQDDAATPAPIWSDVAAASVTLTTASGVATAEIRVGSWNASQLASLPLGNLGKVVVVTGAGDAVTVEAVSVIQDLH